MDFLLKAGYQLAIGCDKGLFGFDLGDYGLLGGKGRERNVELTNLVGGEVFEDCSN